MAQSGRLICVFTECIAHNKLGGDTVIFHVKSDDRGRTWSNKQPLVPALFKTEHRDPCWNCARITALEDGRLVILVDRLAGGWEGNEPGGEQNILMFFSSDEGESWSPPVNTPMHGMVPDQLIELRQGVHAGRWLVTSHTIENVTKENELWKQRLWYSDDQGKTWTGPQLVAAQKGLKFCEGSILELPSGELICFMRENSCLGLDAFRSISRDCGETWEGVYPFALPGCHRPVAGMLQSGKVLITYRFAPGSGAQNLLAAITDPASCLALKRADGRIRIRPLDYDRHPVSDLGYTGWVEFPDREIYAVNYIMDDAPKAQIRGYSFREEDF